jgi:hypothetical protein
MLAKAGIQKTLEKDWIPVYTGMTDSNPMQ